MKTIVKTIFIFTLLTFMFLFLYGCNLNSPLVEVPIAPTNLHPTVEGSTSILLQWDDNSFNETKFRIRYNTTGDFSGTNVTKYVDPDSVSFLVTGLNPNTKYHFEVLAMNSAGLSDYISTEATTGS